VAEHIADEVTACRGLLVDWDVVNEPCDNHVITDILGEDAMAEWFALARAHDPAAKLYINDFNILAAAGQDFVHQDRYERWIHLLIDRGAPLDGIGMQGHFDWGLTPPDTLLRILDRYAAFGREIAVTEFDIDITDERLQADYLRDFMTTLFSHPAVGAIIMWGFWEGSHWRPNAALWRRDWSLKPVGQAWLDLVFKDWWTEATGRTNAAGRFTTRGFLGDYLISAGLGNQRASANVSLTRTGTAIDLTVA
jgi:GH35 family endo-1,4-beta-xylanase